MGNMGVKNSINSLSGWIEVITYSGRAQCASIPFWSLTWRKSRSPVKNWLFLKLLQLQLKHVFSPSWLPSKLENGSIRLGGKTRAEHVLYLLYWWNFTLAGQWSTFWNDKIDGLAFQWLSLHLSLLLLLVCAQLSGCYKCTRFSPLLSCLPASCQCQTHIIARSGSY